MADIHALHQPQDRQNAVMPRLRQGQRVKQITFKLDIHRIHPAFGPHRRGRSTQYPADGLASITSRSASPHRSAPGWWNSSIRIGWACKGAPLPLPDPQTSAKPPGSGEYKQFAKGLNRKTEKAIRFFRLIYINRAYKGNSDLINY